MEKQKMEIGDYYIGLDPGTNSCGWATTETDYSLKRFHGKDMWGVRLFDNDIIANKKRRTARTNRRRIARRNQRLALLEDLFAPFILPIDPNFFIRLDDSFYYEEDKTEKNCKYSLFNDKNFTDKEYFEKYHTIYHLRNDLVQSTETHDPRLVYLAIAHLLKHRGHFLYAGSDFSGNSTLKESLENLSDYLDEMYDLEFKPVNIETFMNCLTSKQSKKEKKTIIKESYGFSKKILVMKMN